MDAVVRLTPFTMRVYRALATRGAMKAGEISRLLYPNVRKAPVIGGSLGRLQRAGLVTWSPRDNRYTAVANPGVRIEEANQ